MKRLVILLSVGIISFILGWYGHMMNQFVQGVKEDSKHFDSLTKNRNIVIPHDKLDQILWQQVSINPQTDCSILIKGRFILDDANYAGFEFFDYKKIIWRNEIACSAPDTLAIFWLDNSTFITKDIKRTNENCPPQNRVYKVEKFDGSNLILKELWTGWGEYEVSEIKFHKDIHLTLKK